MNSREPFQIALCEHATFHPDGTYTIVKGGFTYWSGALPFQLSTMGFVQTLRSQVGEGHRPLTIEIHDADGNPVSKVAGQAFVPPSSAPITYFIVPIQGTLQRYGTFTITIQVGEAKGTVTFEMKAAA